jgi:hypothetical protein
VERLGIGARRSRSTWFGPHEKALKLATIFPVQGARATELIAASRAIVRPSPGTSGGSYGTRMYVASSKPCGVNSGWRALGW